MKFEFFGTLQIISFLAWLTFFIVAAHWIRSQHTKDPEFKFYLPHFYFKIFAGIFFGYIYSVFYENGGDTIHYWDCAERLNDLFWVNPNAYFNELWSTPDPTNRIFPQYYQAVGNPPSWIYFEKNSFFIAKITSFFCFFGFKSYFTINLFFTVISSAVSWKFYKFCIKVTELSMNRVAIAVLFIPSVAFWCSGIIKDTVSLIAVYILIIKIFEIIRKENKILISHLFWIFFCSYILLQTRSFILVAAFLPFVILYTFRVNRHQPFIIKNLSRIAGVLLIFTTFYFYLSSESLFGEFSANNISTTAEVIHDDFKGNESYTGKKYDLGIDEFTPVALLKAFPTAVITSLFRPFIWEGEGPLMLLSGLESLFLMYFSIQIFRRKKLKKIKIRFFDNDFNFYALIFILIVGFFVGITSVLFGALVRFKAPILPFLLLIVFYKYKKETVIDDSENSKKMLN